MAAVQVRVLSPVLVGGSPVDPGVHAFDPLTASRLVGTMRAELVNVSDAPKLAVAEQADTQRAMAAERRRWS